MKISSLNEEQKQALLDLLVLGIYADNMIAAAEDERIQRIVDGFGFESDYERKQFVDASFTRASHHAESPADTRAFVTSIAPVFDNAELRRETFSMLGSLLASDGKFSSLESNFLAMVKEIFHV
jgi:uncharacterized tellurite resistance protein B-like protein